MKLSIVIVSWNVKALLQDCLQSILDSDYVGDLEIIVVDSASGDDSVAMVQQHYPQVTLIVRPDNLGYAKGNNLGITHCQGDYIFLLNPDTHLEPTALTVLCGYLHAHPEIGVIGPQLLWADGAIQSSRRRYPSLGSLFLESTLLELWFPHNAAGHHYRFNDKPAQTAQPVEWLVGAALMLRREVWETVGSFDETFFMYFEETDWCHRVAQTGWQLHYVPQAQVTHYEGQSSGQVVVHQIINFNHSKIRYTEKYFGRMWANLLRFFLCLTFIIQWSEEGLKRSLGHKPALRQERMNIYRQVLKSLRQI